MSSYNADRREHCGMIRGFVQQEIAGLHPAVRGEWIQLHAKDQIGSEAAAMDKIEQCEGVPQARRLHRHQPKRMIEIRGQLDDVRPRRRSFGNLLPSPPVGFEQVVEGCTLHPP